MNAEQRSLAEGGAELPDALPPPGVCSVCGVSSPDLEKCLRPGIPWDYPPPERLPAPPAASEEDEEISITVGHGHICGALICPMCWELHQAEPHVDPTTAAAAS